MGASSSLNQAARSSESEQLWGRLKEIQSSTEEDNLSRARPIGYGQAGTAKEHELDLDFQEAMRLTEEKLTGSKISTGSKTSAFAFSGAAGSGAQSSRQKLFGN